VRLRHYSAVVQQYKNPDILEEVKKVVVTGLGKEKFDQDIYEARRIAYWFQHYFMSWDNSPDLVRTDDILTLLKTRTGRCGEWANLFTCMLHSVGIKANLVLDFSDHVWTEVARHPIDSTLADPLITDPLSREKAGKKLSYIVAFSPNRVEDVTHFYVSNWNKVRKRRKLDPIAGYLIDLYNRGRTPSLYAS